MDFGNFRQKKSQLPLPPPSSSCRARKGGKTCPAERGRGKRGFEPPDTLDRQDLGTSQILPRENEYSMNVYPIEIQFGDDCIFILFTFIDLEYFKSQRPIGCLLIVRSKFSDIKGLQGPAIL